MSILVDDSNKTACRAAEAGLQQKNCAALVRPAGTGKGCIVWELLDAPPEMRWAGWRWLSSGPACWYWTAGGR